MSSTPKTPVDNPSLGTLERLPAELRNIIYELVIDTEYELEADYHKPCRRRQSLHLVSKQVHDETKGFLAAMRDRPCEHVNFIVTIPGIPETPGTVRALESIAQRVHPAHNITQAQTIRFVTGHLDGDAPLAVTCHLRLPSDSSCEVYGASRPRTDYIIEEIDVVLGTLAQRVFLRGELSGSPDRFKLADVEDLAMWVMALSVEKIPDEELHGDALYCWMGRLSGRGGYRIGI